MMLTLQLVLQFPPVYDFANIFSIQEVLKTDIKQTFTLVRYTVTCMLLSFHLENLGSCQKSCIDSIICRMLSVM